MSTLRFALALAALVGAFAPGAVAANELDDIELEDVVTNHPVHDAIVEDSQRAVPARVEMHTDSHGHRITIGTDIPSLDLGGYASVLGQTLHGAEIAQILVEVVPWEQIDFACDAESVSGCYFPSQRRMVVTDYDPRGVHELVHTIVHEYGHHVDQGLENLGHLNASCDGRDGSRNWWWVRVPDRFTCLNENWELLIAELYAEDYTASHGIAGWQMTTIGPPSAFVQSQVVHDFNTRFEPATLTGSAFVRRHRAQFWAFSVKHWTWLDARLRGPYAADLDLYLFRRGARTPLRRSERLGSVERVRATLRPGRYEIGVRAARAGARARVRVVLD